MPSHSRRGLQRPLQIHLRAGPKLDQRRLPQRFRRQSDGEFGRLSVERGDCEAGAVDGNAVAKVYVLEYGFGADFHVESAVVGGAELLDFAHFFNYAGEEGFDLGFVVVAAAVVRIGFVGGEEERI